MECTKGKWEMEQRGENCFVILGSERQVVATVDLVYRDRELAERENLANANLIASAPKLDRYREYVDTKIDIDEIPLRYEEFEEIIIAKAEGKDG